MRFWLIVTLTTTYVAQGDTWSLLRSLTGEVSRGTVVRTET